MYTPQITKRPKLRPASINARQFQLAAWSAMCRGATNGAAHRKKIEDARELERLHDYARKEAA